MRAHASYTRNLWTYIFLSKSYLSSIRIPSIFSNSPFRWMVHFQKHFLLQVLVVLVKFSNLCMFSPAPYFLGTLLPEQVRFMYAGVAVRDVCCFLTG